MNAIDLPAALLTQIPAAVAFFGVGFVVRRSSDRSTLLHEIFALIGIGVPVAVVLVAGPLLITGQNLSTSDEFGIYVVFALGWLAIYGVGNFWVRRKRKADDEKGTIALAAIAIIFALLITILVVLYVIRFVTWLAKFMWDFYSAIQR